MATTQSTTETVSEPSIERTYGTNAYGDRYAYHVCTGCDVEAGARWQVRVECTCGGQA